MKIFNMKMWNTQQTENTFRDLKLGLEILQNMKKIFLLNLYTSYTLRNVNTCKF